jgi:hypothetical protein
VWGKWCAAAAQSLLVAVAIVPHLLARYLNRGTSFIEEGILLLMILFLSGGVAGVFTAASVIKSPLLRNAFAGAVMLGVYIWVCRPLISAVTSAGSLIPVAIQCEVMVLSIWAALFCMWHAAANIAPAVANLTTARRLTSLVAVVIFSALAGAVSGASEGVPEYGLLIMLGAISAVEMGEPLSPFPFKRSGGAGEVAGFLLSPGWNTGVLFCIVTWVVTGISSGMIFHPWFLAAISLCFFPVTARLIFPARMRMGVTPMVLLAGASHVLRMLLLSVDVSAEAFVGWLPGLYDRSAMRATETYVIPAIMWTGLALALALGSLLFHMRRRKG